MFLSAAVGTTVASAAPAKGAGLPIILPFEKGRHDICIGTIDANGVQHPWFCINLPQTPTSGKK